MVRVRNDYMRARALDANPVRVIRATFYRQRHVDEKTALVSFGTTGPDMLVKLPTQIEATLMNLRKVKYAILKPPCNGRVYGKALGQYDEWIFISPTKEIARQLVPISRRYFHFRHLLETDARKCDIKIDGVPYNNEAERLREYGRWSTLGFLAKSRRAAAEVVLSTDIT